MRAYIGDADGRAEGGSRVARVGRHWARAGGSSDRAQTGPRAGELIACTKAGGQPLHARGAREHCGIRASEEGREAVEAVDGTRIEGRLH